MLNKDYLKSYNLLDIGNVERFSRPKLLDGEIYEQNKKNSIK